MFEVGEKVVDSGVRAGEDGDYLHDGLPEMDRWHSEKAVLAVSKVISTVMVKAGVGKDTYCYHPSELRYATPSEIEAAEDSTEGKPEIGPGSVVNRKSGGVFVVLREKDDDGNYVASVASKVFRVFDGLLYLKDSDIESVTGTIDEDGMFTPADKASESDGTEACKSSLLGGTRPTWRDLKAGDVIRISDDNREACNWSRGKIVRVGRIDHNDPCLPIKVEALDADSDWIGIGGNAGDFEIIERA